MYYRLNKYQKEWIKKLLSGNTRKGIGVLYKNQTRCCLGVGAQVCGLKYNQIWGLANLSEFSTTETVKDIDNKLKLRGTGCGDISFDSLKAKWKEFFITTLNIESDTTLCELNDGNWIGSSSSKYCHIGLSHKMIGQIINENREAVFKR